MKIIMTHGIGVNDIHLKVESDDYFKLTASAISFLSTDMIYKWWQNQTKSTLTTVRSSATTVQPTVVIGPATAANVQTTAATDQPTAIICSTTAATVQPTVQPTVIMCPTTVQSNAVIGPATVVIDQTITSITHRPSNMLYYVLQIHHVVGIAGYLIAWYTQKGQMIVSNLSLFEISSIPLLFYSSRIYVAVSLPATWISYLTVRILWGNWMLIDGLTQLSTENIEISQHTLLFLYGIHAFFLIANNYWFYLLTKKFVRLAQVTWLRS